MPDLSELLAAEAARYEVRQPPVSAIRRRRQRRVAARTGGALVALALGIGGAVLLTPGTEALTEREERTAQDPPTTPGPEAVSGPSQSEQDARRDGVLPEVAALPFVERVRIVAQEEAPEGVWAVTRIPGGPGVLGDPAGRYGVDWVQRAEYGELVLLDTAGTRILRAYPLPGVPPGLLRVHDSGVYCARRGDGALPVSMLCRIDRNTFELAVRVFLPTGPDAPELEQTLLPTWRRDPSAIPQVLDALVDCGSSVCAQGRDGQATIDAGTLDIALQDATVKAPPPEQISRTDEFGRLTLASEGSSILIDADRVDMLGGTAAEEAAAARGDEVSNDYYLVNDNPQLRRYRLSPQAVVWGSIGLTRTVEHQRVNVQDLLRYLRSDTEQNRSTLFHLQVEDGWVVGVEEQYRP
jgi:hypothetical protein